MASSNRPITPQQLCYSDRLQDEMVSGSKLHQEMGHKVLSQFEGCLLLKLSPSRFLNLLSDCLVEDSLPVQGILFQPFHSTPSLRQGILSGVGVGSQDRNSSASLP